MELGLGPTLSLSLRAGGAAEVQDGVARLAQERSALAEGAVQHDEDSHTDQAARDQKQNRSHTRGVIAVLHLELGQVGRHQPDRQGGQQNSGAECSQHRDDAFAGRGDDARPGNPS